jgi:AcrR family transcriptional regulator
VADGARAGGPRRQERGRRRIEAVLDVAERLVAAHGIDTVSTNRIAAEAGISPGSLYQFFANKEAVVAGLADRCLVWVAAQGVDLTAAELVPLPADELAARVVAPLVDVALAHPVLRVLLAVERTSPWAAATERLHTAMCTSVEVLLARRTGRAVPDAADRTAAAMTTAVFAAGLGLVAEADGAQRSRLVDALRQAVAGYWSALDSGGPPRPAELNP